MTDKILLRLYGISHSNQLQSDAYAIILAEVNGPINIPIVVGPVEAQSIAMSMEHIKPQRPMTHDLFVTFSHSFGITLKEVFIYNFEDGIFYSEMTFSNNERTIVVDARTSDAIAIAIRCQAPIYTTPKVLEETGFVMEEEDNSGQSQQSDELDMATDYPSSKTSEPKIENYSIEELEKLLEKLISQENYEEAAKVSEILKKKKNQQQ